MSVAQITAKLCIVALALLAFVAPVSAASVVFLANPPAGNDNNPCSFASPCQTLGGSLGKLDSNGQVTCAQGTAFGSAGFPVQSVIIDCPGLFVPNQTAFEGFLGEFVPDGIVIKIRHLTVNGQFAGTGAGGVSITGGSGGTLVLEDCVFENFSGTAIQIAPNGPYTLILRNTRISNNAGGVLIKPAAGGSVTATFDGVTIDQNTGGLRTDSTNGAVTVDVANSRISNNTANGIVAIGGAGGTNMVTLKSDLIGANGQAGIVANGGNAAVLVTNTLLDSNKTGATSVVAGGRILTYGNNSTIGAAGSGFTGTAPLN
jgi:Right handed beta helix region